MGATLLRNLRHSARHGLGSLPQLLHVIDQLSQALGVLGHALEEIVDDDLGLGEDLLLVSRRNKNRLQLMIQGD